MDVPPEELQGRITDRTGADALAVGHQIYTLFRQLYEEQTGPIDRGARVLDFGCGWGRVARFFAPEVDLVGIDIDDQAIQACRTTVPLARFERCEVIPPSGLGAGEYDLIYAYSVFSHLSEEVHLRWLEEFQRLLRPGGVLILTTLARSMIERAADWTGTPGWRGQAARTFSPSDRWLADYDDGKYCFAPLAGRPHFGFAAIPERYVHEVWSSYFDVSSFGKRDPALQPVIVCRRG